MRRRALRGACASLGLCAMLVGCATEPQPPVASLDAADSVAMQLDSTLQLQVTALSAGGSTLQVPLSWLSLDTAIATVDSDGLVHARNLGVARIVVAADTLSAGIRVSVLTRFVELAISASDGMGNACFRAADGQVFCSAMEKVAAARGLSGLSVGRYRACGLASDSSAYCWGTTPPGDGSNSAALPVRVAGAQRYAGLNTVEKNTCGLTASGALWCWGLNADAAMTGDVPAVALTPVAAAPTLVFSRVTAAAAERCGMTPAGAVYCWGNNNYDQISVAGNPGGCSGDPCVSTPHRILPDSILSDVSNSHFHGCVLTAAGQAWCWGYNSSGALGDSSWTGCWVRTSCSTIPQQVTTTQRFSSLALGLSFSCGLTATGTAWCWGGLIGGGSSHAAPEPVAGGQLAFTRLVAGGHDVCGLASDQRWWCWSSDSATPARVAHQW